MKISGIYKITNTVTSKVYVGSSIDIAWRWNRHRYHLRRGTHHNCHLQRAFNEYGEQALVYSVLEECCSSEFVAKEQAHMDDAKAADPKYGYNIIPFSDHHGHSEETKQKLKMARGKRPPASEETRRKMSLAASGRIQSQETRAKVSAALRARIRKPESYVKRSEKMVGRIPWNKGLKASDETRLKLSLTHRGPRGKMSSEAILKRTASRLANNGGLWRKG